MLDTKPNRSACITELARLGGLPNFPTEKPAQKALVDAMIRHCRDAQHAGLTVSALEDALEFAPRPLDIREAAEAIGEKPPVVSACETCGGTGYSPPQWREVRGVPYQFTDRCACPLGRWYAEDEARRKAATAKDAEREVARDGYLRRLDWKMAAGGEG